MLAKLFFIYEISKKKVILFKDDSLAGKLVESRVHYFQFYILLVRLQHIAKTGKKYELFHF